MGQPILAGSAPTACAACYGQYPDRAHIDYRAAIEGRLVDPSQPRGRHVDWVVICESCLRAGLDLLPEQRDQREAAQATEAALRAELAEVQAYSLRLEEAIAIRPDREHAHPVVTPAPEPEPEPEPEPATPAPAPSPPAKRQSRYAPKDQA